MQKEVSFYNNFKPELTPKKMLELGVFGGSYLGDTLSEFPKSWFTKAKLSKKFNVELNYFQIKAGLTLKEWQKKVGLWKKILGVGFNGIAALQWEEGLLKLIKYKYLDYVPKKTVSNFIGLGKFVILHDSWKYIV